MLLEKEPSDATALAFFCFILFFFKKLDLLLCTSAWNLFKIELDLKMLFVNPCYTAAVQG